MNLLMISGDRSVLEGKQGAFWQTLEAFHKEWERIDIICPRIEKSEIRNQKSAPSFFGNVYFHASPWGLLQQPKWIEQKGRELASARQYSVMTVQEYPPFYNGLGAKRLCQATGIPAVLEIHHIVGWPKAGSLQERIGYWLSWLFLRRHSAFASGIRAVSKSIAEKLLRLGIPEKKLRVVPSLYLDRAAFEKPLPPQRACDVVFSGRLVANKGVIELLEAVAKLPDVTLAIGGDGPLRKQLEEQAQRLDIRHRVEFRGWLETQQDVFDLLRSGKIFVMNSKSEGGPRIAVEAMACGLPVIATKVGVMPEVIIDGQNGVFTTGESDDLAQQMQRLLQDAELRERLGAEARKVLDRFERGLIIRRYADYLKSFAVHA